MLLDRPSGLKSRVYIMHNSIKIQGEKRQMFFRSRIFNQLWKIALVLKSRAECVIVDISLFPLQLQTTKDINKLE